jgi:hypothetical protein
MVISVWQGMDSGLALDVPVSRPGSAWPDIIQKGSMIFGTAAKYAGMYMGAQNQYAAASAESALMQTEAGFMDYNAYLAALERRNIEHARDIEIDQHREDAKRTLGRQRAFYGWGNISVSDPNGTPMQVRLRSMYNAEYNEKIIIERGDIKVAQAKGKEVAYKYKAAQIRAGAKGVEAGGSIARSAGFVSMAGELAKDIGGIV